MTNDLFFARNKRGRENIRLKATKGAYPPPDALYGPYPALSKLTMKRH